MIAGGKVSSAMCMAAYSWLVYNHNYVTSPTIQFITEKINIKEEIIGHFRELCLSCIKKMRQG